MHYHIDAWIWAIKKQLANVGPEEKPATRKFLDWRIKEKAEGCTFFGVTLADNVTMAPDMRELVGLLEEWTEIYNTGKRDYADNLPRKLKIEGKKIVPIDDDDDDEGRRKAYG